MIVNPDKFQAIILDKQKRDHTDERTVEPQISKYIKVQFKLDFSNSGKIVRKIGGSKDRMIQKKGAY